MTDDLAVRLAMRAPRTTAPPDPRPGPPACASVGDDYADRPTELFTVVGEDTGPFDEDEPRTSADAVLVPVDEAPALDDTSWGTPAYATRRPRPVLEAEITPPWGRPWRGGTPRGPGVRPPARVYVEDAIRHPGASDGALVGIAIGVSGAVFAAAGLVITALAYFAKAYGLAGAP